MDQDPGPVGGGMKVQLHKGWGTFKHPKCLPQQPQSRDLVESGGLIAVGCGGPGVAERAQAVAALLG